jgi:hypothetical protein
MGKTKVTELHDWEFPRYLFLLFRFLEQSVLDFHVAMDYSQRVNMSESLEHIQNV